MISLGEIRQVRCPVCWAEPQKRCRVRRVHGKNVTYGREMSGVHWPRRVRAIRVGVPKPKDRKAPKNKRRKWYG
jgi:hypothetical protein